MSITSGSSLALSRSRCARSKSARRRSPEPRVVREAALVIPSPSSRSANCSSGSKRRGVKPASWSSRQKSLRGLAKCAAWAAETRPGLIPQKTQVNPGARTSGTALVLPARLLKLEEQELRELARGEVVVADQDDGAMTVGQRGTERHPLDVVERDPERVEVEEQRLLRRADRAELPGQAVDPVHVRGPRKRDAVQLDRVARPGNAGRERAFHGDQELVVQG